MRKLLKKFSQNVELLPRKIEKTKRRIEKIGIVENFSNILRNFQSILETFWRNCGRIEKIIEKLRRNLEIVLRYFEKFQKKNME